MFGATWMPVILRLCRERCGSAAQQDARATRNCNRRVRFWPESGHQLRLPLGRIHVQVWCDPEVRTATGFWFVDPTESRSTEVRSIAP